MKSKWWLLPSIGGWLATAVALVLTVLNTLVLLNVLAMLDQIISIEEDQLYREMAIKEMAQNQLKLIKREPAEFGCVVEVAQ